MIWGIPRATGRLAVSFPALVLGWSLIIAAGPVVTLTSIRHSSTPDRTRIVIDLTGKTDYSHRVLSDPPRVLIDLPQGAAADQIQPRTVSDGFVKDVRLTDLRSGKVQIVLDLEKPADYAVFTLTNPFRIVVDVKHSGAPAAGAGTKSKTPPASDVGSPGGAPASSAGTVVTAPVESRPPLEIAPPPHDAWVIAIDAGHGGQDQGAHYFKTNEKDITLDLARQIKTELERRQETGTPGPSMKPILVRKGDYFIPLRRRWILAEKQGANLFVSVHCNANPDPKAQGTEVYFLSLKGATDAGAEALAQRENQVDEQMGVSTGEDDLDAIVFDMMQTDVLAKSQMLAESCLNHMFGLGTVYGRGVKQAGFAVLKCPRMPSILIEAAFLSHKSENDLLRDPGWQREFARRVADGIEAYVRGVAATEKPVAPDRAAGR
jgi:N-acetylmuramoyl-L-alanine amidase